MRFFIIFLCFFPIFAYSEEPWGRDADLAVPVQEYVPELCKTPFLGRFAEFMIYFHQNVISPADGPRSNHKPNSSQYTLDAMRKYGFFCGFLMGCDRLMRENDDPWIYEVVTDENGDSFKWDPVK